MHGGRLLSVGSSKRRPREVLHAIQWRPSTTSTPLGELTLRYQNINLPQLGDNLCRLVALSRHSGTPKNRSLRWTTSYAADDRLRVRREHGLVSWQLSEKNNIFELDMLAGRIPRISQASSPASKAIRRRFCRAPASVGKPSRSSEHGLHRSRAPFSARTSFQTRRACWSSKPAGRGGTTGATFGLIASCLRSLPGATLRSTVCKPSAVSTGPSSDPSWR